MGDHFSGESPHVSEEEYKRREMQSKREVEERSREHQAVIAREFASLDTKAAMQRIACIASDIILLVGKGDAVEFKGKMRGRMIAIDNVSVPERGNFKVVFHNEGDINFVKFYCENPTSSDSPGVISITLHLGKQEEVLFKLESIYSGEPDGVACKLSVENLREACVFLALVQEVAKKEEQEKEERKRLDLERERQRIEAEKGAVSRAIAAILPGNLFIAK